MGLDVFRHQRLTVELGASKQEMCGGFVGCL